MWVRLVPGQTHIRLTPRLEDAILSYCELNRVYEREECAERRLGTHCRFLTEAVGHRVFLFSLEARDTSE